VGWEWATLVSSRVNECYKGTVRIKFVRVEGRDAEGEEKKLGMGETL